MKILRNFLTLFFFFSFTGAFAQVTEGKVSYDITYPNIKLEKEQMEMLPSQSIIWFKGDQAMMDTKMAMGMSMNTIIDPTGTIVLMDIMGRKMAIKKEKEKNEKAKSKVTMVDGEKIIAGYKCKKAIIDDDNSKLEIWYTDEIHGTNSFGSSYDGVKGFLMEFNMKNQQMDMHMVANNVSTEKVDPSFFLIPADYKLMSEDDMKKMFGGK